MKNIIDIVNDAILDVCANPLVENGVFNPDNNEHMFLLMENLDGRLEEEHIAKAVSALRCEGKHPERQAFNKEGWLVTFPSREYRDAAIKRGTHSLADPTHGKGGMNLYYKKRGKQKRMTQQTQSGEGSGIQQPPAQPDAAPLTQQPQAKPEAPQAPATPQEKPKADAPQTPAKPASADIKPDDSSLPTVGLAEPPKGSSGIAPRGDASLSPSDKPAPEKPVEKPVEAPKYKEITEKFATSKGWESTPYGEWRDKSGNTVAVVSLGGEVTPIKSNDREELKLFAEKQG